MGYLIGIDEAGYGPNLGPLVIAASLWRVPGTPRRIGDLYDSLSDVVCRSATRSDDEGECPAPRLPIADSKELYSPQVGLETLETSVLSMLRCCGIRAADCQALWNSVAPTTASDIDAVPWHAEFNPKLPLAAPRKAVNEWSARVKSGLRAARIRLVSLRALVIFPARFNQLVDEHGGKGAALSRQSVSLLSSMLEGCGRGPTLAYGDKHGGRNFYSRFLQEAFPDHLVEIYGEGSEESIYRFGPSERRVEVRFRVRGEEMLPVALASMTAKYLREVSMRAFNEFWMGKVPELKATAGYPGDSRRFKREIEPAQAALGIDDHILWRTR